MKNKLSTAHPSKRVKDLNPCRDSKDQSNIGENELRNSNMLFSQKSIDYGAGKLIYLYKKITI